MEFQKRLWKKIAFQCYLKYEYLIDKLAIKRDKPKGRPQLYTLTTIDDLKRLLKEGKFEYAYDRAKFETEQLSRHASKQTVWRYKKRLLKIGIKL